MRPGARFLRVSESPLKGKRVAGPRLQPAASATQLSVQTESNAPWQKNEIWVVRVSNSGQCLASAMNISQFLRIERDGDGSRHYVVHTHDPKLTLELSPDSSASDKIGKGIIKRISVPNSWAGDYTKYAKFISAAQEFFGKSFEEPAPKSELRRFQP